MYLHALEYQVAAHLRGRDDALVRVAPLLELAPNWRRLLTSVIGEVASKNRDREVAPVEKSVAPG